MLKENSTTLQSRRNSPALFLGIGFVLGFSVALVLGYWCFLKPKDVKTHHTEQWGTNAAKSTIDTLSLSAKIKSSSMQNASTLNEDEPTDTKADDLQHETHDAENIEEVEFSMSNKEEDIVVSHHTLLDSRKVRVHIMPSTNAESYTEAPIESFELQLWSSPIKNRMEYLRSGNVIKVKGMDISQVELIYQNGHYVLLYAHKKYAIPVNTAFEKIVEDSLQ